MIDLDDEFPGTGLHLGIVIDRNDPLGLKRVRVRVPGRLPESDWLWPFGFTAGPKRGGGQTPPPLKAKVLCAWLAGEVDGIGVFIPGMFHQGWVPSGTVHSDEGDREVWQNDRFRLEIDTLPSTVGIRLGVLDESGGEESIGSGVRFELDLTTLQVRLSGVTGFQVDTEGAGRLNASVLTLNGRPVRPGSDPI